MKVHEIINELTFFGSKCKDDCSGHMAGWKWEKKHATNNRQNTPSPSFDNGTEIAVKQRSAGKSNIIGPAIKGAKGRFTKYTGK